MKHDFLVVGAGMFGAAFARTATDLGRTCLVIDRKPHVAGAAHDVLLGTTHVAKYGAHVFHTSSEEVWQFVQRFADWEPYRHTVKARIGSKLYPLPINLTTLHMLWGVTTPKEASEELERRRKPCVTIVPRNMEEWALSTIGEELYEKFVRVYTRKQYGREPSTLPASILQRLPIRLTHDDSYFTSTYCAMPKDGYTSFVCNLLHGVDVRLEQPFYGLGGWRKFANRLVYSGPADELFGFEQGKLEYSSMHFTYELRSYDYQGCSVVNYCDDSVPYLRMVEYKHFKRDVRKHQLELGPEQSHVTADWPDQVGEPLYPIRTEENVGRHATYLQVAARYGGIALGGRLGEYRYYDMDQAIASGIAKARKLCE